MKLFILSLTAGILAAASLKGADPIVVTGSDTMLVLGQKWAEVYATKNPAAQIQVVGGGSTLGIEALHNRRTHLANSSRPLRGLEIGESVRYFGSRPYEVKAALDALLIYVHPSNPVSTLTLDQLHLIFTGKITNWKEVGGPDARISVYTRHDGSGTYELFKTQVLYGKEVTTRARWLFEPAALAQAVGQDENGIGYGGAAFVKGTKALKLKRTDISPEVQANSETVANGTYPLSRFLYIYLDPDLNRGDISKYLKWIRTAEAQEVVKEAGFYPLPPHLQEKT